jgi:hypothetical protein
VTPNSSFLEQIPEIPDLRSARDHGPWSAYCHICWYPVFTLWIDKEPPPNKTCMHGASCAAQCPDALGRAKTSAEIKRCRALSLANMAKSDAEPNKT